MRRILYILLLLPLIVLSYRIYSQSPPPMWQYFCMNGVCVPTFTTQLVYAVNITSIFTSSSYQYLAFTVPEQVLQQQLQYCKTYDSFVTNNVSPSQCEFAWPAVVAITDQNGTVINYWTEYQLGPISYDNTTGLPQTLAFPINLPDKGVGGISLSPGTYYLYVYYPSPFLFAGNSIQGPSVPYCPSNLINVQLYAFNGGWCGLYSSTSAYGGAGGSYTSERSINSGNNIAPSTSPVERILGVSYNPAYPVIVGTNANGGSFCYGYSCQSYGSLVVLGVTNPYINNTINICFGENYAFSQGCTFLAPSPYGIFDLRKILLSNGYDPNKYNVISYIIVAGISSASYLVPRPTPLFLYYVPSNQSS